MSVSLFLFVDFFVSDVSISSGNDSSLVMETMSSSSPTVDGGRAVTVAALPVWPLAVAVGVSFILLTFLDSLPA